MVVMVDFSLFVVVVGKHRGAGLLMVKLLDTAGLSERVLSPSLLPRQLNF